MQNLLDKPYIPTQKERLIEVANDTIKIVDQGFYINKLGQTVNISQLIKYSNANTQYYENYENFKYTDLINPNSKINLNVIMETTVNGILRMDKKGGKTIVLNFASAKNPGGGFLKGAIAQEESLARVSSLYSSLLKCHQFYDNIEAPYYTNRIIYSPDVPFFKNSDDQIMDNPILASVITCAAPNLSGLKVFNHLKIRDIFVSRIYNILSLAHDKGYDNVILGAWGTGVFKNDPHFVSKWFKWVINQEFKNKFKNITFSIYDPTFITVNKFK